MNLLSTPSLLLIGVLSYGQPVNALTATDCELILLMAMDAATAKAEGKDLDAVVAIASQWTNNKAIINLVVRYVMRSDKKSFGRVDTLGIAGELYDECKLAALDD